MNKGVKKARQSIMSRKRKRKYNTIHTPRRFTQSFPQEEEKHGYLPMGFEEPPRKKGDNTKFPYQLLVKGTLALMIFVLSAFMLRTELPMLDKPKEWTSHVLTEELPFAKLNQWYQATFGSPLAFTPGKADKINHIGMQSLPVAGDVTQSFLANGSGIMIEPKELTPVSAWSDGVIIFAGNDSETKKTVIIQHADGSKSMYGHLSSIHAHLYQFVTASQMIGRFDPTKESEVVYFAIERDKKYVDPVQVIKVDDIP